MTVCLIDKRRRGQQIPSVEMPNHTWFCVLDIDGMDTLVDTRHYCDTATATPAKAKKMAALIETGLHLMVGAMGMIQIGTKK